jgi:hypothetical protein
VIFENSPSRLPLPTPRTQRKTTPRTRQPPPAAATALRRHVADSQDHETARPLTTLGGVEPVKRSLTAVPVHASLQSTAVGERAVLEQPKALVEGVEVGAGGVEPPSSSVSGIRGATWRPAADGRVCSVSRAVVCPVVTGVVRCDPVGCGPDVAPMWPSGPELGRHLRGAGRSLFRRRAASSGPIFHGPWLTLGGRFRPSVRARGGHGWASYAWPGSHPGQRSRMS